MRSVTCPSCDFVSWAVGNNCKRCGKPLPSDYSAPQPPPQPAYDHGYDYGAAPDQYGTAPNYYGAGHDYFAPPQKKRTGRAVASLTLGVIGFFTFGLLFLGTIVGTSLGMSALRKQAGDPAKYGGKGIAIAGIVLNIAALVMVFPLGMIAAVAIPNLLAARRAANEASALNTIRVVSTAEQTYKTMNARDEYGELHELVGEHLIDPQISAGEKHGYQFHLVKKDDDFEFSATPVEGAGRYSFLYRSEDGEIHVRADGRDATANDPTLELRDDRESPYGSRRAVSTGPAYAPSN